jgi:hypothetical protein
VAAERNLIVKLLSRIAAEHGTHRFFRSAHELVIDRPRVDAVDANSA